MLVWSRNMNVPAHNLFYCGKKNSLSGKHITRSNKKKISICLHVLPGKAKLLYLYVISDALLKTIEKAKKRTQRTPKAKVPAAATPLKRKTAAARKLTLTGWYL